MEKFTRCAQLGEILELDHATLKFDSVFLSSPTKVTKPNTIICYPNSSFCNGPEWNMFST